MANIPNEPFLRHHDLRIGKTFNVPRTYRSPLAAKVRDAVVRSHIEKAYVPVEGTPFQLTVFLRNESDGNGGVWVSSTEALARGKLPAQSQLYSATLACNEATAPLAWRCITNQYLEHMLEAPPKAHFHAPGLMPRQTPWLCGFLEANPVMLADEEWEMLLQIVWPAALDILDRCERAVTRIESKGIRLVPDPDRYLELKKWD